MPQAEDIFQCFDMLRIKFVGLRWRFWQTYGGFRSGESCQLDFLIKSRVNDHNISASVFVFVFDDEINWKSFLEDREGDKYHDENAAWSCR